MCLNIWIFYVIFLLIHPVGKKKKKAFKDAPKTKSGTMEPLDDSGTDTTDSLENMDDPDRDRYSLFD